MLAATITCPVVVRVVGIGVDGTLAAPLGVEDVVVGSPRHLALLPQTPGQVRVPLPKPLRAGLIALAQQHPRLVVLASGDPLVSGIGTTLIELLGEEQVTIQPALSSLALARAELRWPAHTHAVVSVVGRDLDLVRREMAPRRRILVLSADEHTPAALARLLVESGYGDSQLVVLGRLGGSDSTRQEFTRASAALEGHHFPRLNVVGIECQGPAGPGGTSGWTSSWTSGLPDDAFEHDGQLTKRDLRASALARLAPAPGQHLWDVGAGAGSVGIEWMRAHPTCTATAIEASPERAARIIRNAARLGVPGLQVVTATAPEALAGLPEPDAIFVGGGATRPGVIEACLATGARLVVHGVTVETEQLLAGLYRSHGGELTRIAVESAAPIGSFTGWTPARTVTQWAR